MTTHQGTAPSNGRVTGLTDLQHLVAPTPTRQQVFHAPEVWLILQMMDAVEPFTGVPPDAGFDAQALVGAHATLHREGLLRTDEQGQEQLAYAAYELVMPAAFPEAVIVATITDHGPEDMPARTICFSRNGDGVVVNWVDAQGDHHFQAYQRQEAGLCVLSHLLNACDLSVTPPPAAQQAAGSRQAPTPREVERAAGQMKQAVSLAAVTGVGTPEQVTRAAGWFVGAGQLWLMRTPQEGQQGVPHPASLEEVARTVLGLAEQVLEHA